MWTPFFLQNAHFAINIFTSLVFLAIFWLYFDAWLNHKTLREGLKISGFFLLFLSFLIQSISVEGSGIYSLLVTLTRLSGYLSIICGLLLDPLEPLPKTSAAPAVIWFSTPLSFSPLLLFPLGSLSIAVLYYRRAKVGLEHHVLSIAYGFLFLTLSEILSLTSMFRTSLDINVYTLVAPFGLVWIIQQLTLLITAFVLGRWIFGYLLKRLVSQLFMIQTTGVLLIFLITTLSFTALLLQNLQTESQKQIQISARILSLAIDNKRQESVSTAAILAQNPTLPLLLSASSSAVNSALADLAQDHLLAKKQSSLTIINAAGQIVARGEDREKIGDNISSDTIVKHVLLGETVSSITTDPGVFTSQISVIGAVPIFQGTEIIGAVLSSNIIDSAFIDGLKKATGLDSSVYGSNSLSATTLTLSGSAGSPVGIKETNPQIITQVLTKGNEYSGATTILGNSYFASYIPLKDIDQTPIGMLVVFRLQNDIFALAAKSIQITFLTTALLLTLSILPNYYVASYLSRQIH